jgi:WD40 repeat protein
VVHLLVLDAVSLHRILSVNLPNDEISKLDWSSDGSRILAQSRRGSWIINTLSRGITCEAAGSTYVFPGFLSSHIFLVARASADSTLLTFYNLRCAKVGSATAPFIFGSADADPGAEVIAVAHPGVGVDMFQTAPWTRAASIPDSDGGPLVALFGGGSGICAGKRMARGDATLRCWNIATARLVSAFRKTNAETKPVASAINAPLIAIQETALQVLSEAAIRKGGRTEEFRQWVIWDPLRGEVRGTLGAKTQRHRLPWRRVDLRVPYTAALSAAGGLFAIAGDSRLEMFSTSR